MVRKYIGNEKLANIIEWVLAITAAVVLSLFIREFIFTTAVVSGPSMAPTLHNGDRVIINRISSWTGSHERGDIVAFPYPANPADKHIKRIIGVPGDYIEARDGRIFVNNELLADDFSPDGAFLTGDMSFPFTVGENVYFMLGDNRLNSKDSRFASVGLIHRDDILGSAWLRFVPVGDMGLIR